ncbi:MAG: carboxypeptidase-like regulatory domain-containing protein [Planctomycetaceae bacterium]|nr:carboxypeptidase-like regulatory domain-containing protein [Planctomycetaceae bacterium]
MLTSACFSGCGERVSVSGTVSFPDGSPLTQGFVVFENGGNQASGIINETGHYQMGENGNSNGITPGEYKVRVISESGGGSDGTPFVRYIADKYDNTNTSGLVCEVKGKTEFNITVEKSTKK